MNVVAHPLRRPMRHAEVGDLQLALKELLDAEMLGARDDAARRELGAALEAERSESAFGSTTYKLVRLFQEEHGPAVSGEVDERTAELLNTLVAGLRGDVDGQDGRRHEVRGVVRFESGVPAEGVAVEAVDLGLRGEERVLRRGESIADGTYWLEYLSHGGRDPRRGAANLVVRAVGEDGSSLVASPVLFDPPAHAHIDLTIPRKRLAPPSLLSRVQKAVLPLLDEMPIDELDERDGRRDLTVLAGKTGLDTRTLARFALAHRLAGMGLPLEFWFALLGDPSFEYTPDLGLAGYRKRAVAQLYRLDELALERTLVAALDSGDIEEAFRESLPAWSEEFTQLMAQRVLKHSDASSFVTAALEGAGVDDAEAQEELAGLLRRHGSLTPELLGTLEEDPRFEEPAIADLSTSFQLADLTRGDFSVVAMVRDEFDVRHPGHLPKLARVGLSRWTSLVAEKLEDGSIQLPFDFVDLEEPLQPEPAEIYATTLEQRFREAFPTQAFAGELERARENGGPQGLKHPDELARLLAHPDFELLDTPIDEFFNDRDEPELRRLAKDESFRRELRAVQRAFKLAPTFKAADALIADGLDNAQRVYRLGESRFVRRFGELTGSSAAEARAVWTRAADTHAAVLTILGELSGLRSGSQPQALQMNTAALETFPNWSSLFRAGDLCSCDHCRSVLGPAAYFADLLLFLGDRLARDKARSVKDVLFERRPDLGWLELTCENANTMLPYIDLVCEVLEDVVAAGEGDVELVGLTTLPTTPAEAASAVRTALEAASLDPGSDLVLWRVDPANTERWVVHGTDLTLLLKKQQSANFYAQVLPNTKADAAELRAYPAYVNAEAYRRLAEATHPFALPFDLFGEEVRAAFESFGVQRWDLMRTLHGAAPAHANEVEIAAEYFGIGSNASAAPLDERGLICLEKPTDEDQEEIWGETRSALAGVKVFLDKSGLEYEQLLALLDLKFVNEQGSLTIGHLDGSCDTDKKRLKGLDAASLDRIHRFLRMWRKLDGWEMWELDLAVRQTGIGDGAFDELFLVNLYRLCRLRARLGAETTVDQLCALFGDLSIETHFTKPHAKRGDGLYRRLFANPKLSRPLDPALNPATIAAAGGTSESILDHRSAVQGALGLDAIDLDHFLGVTRPPDPQHPGRPPQAYISDDLTLENLSFLWRHGWLSRTLKLKTAEWQGVLDLIGEEVKAFGGPGEALAFVEQVERLTASGFSTNELVWLLMGRRVPGSTAPVAEADAARFLAPLRTDIRAARALYDPAQYGFLDPPADVERLQALLTGLLQQLHRDEAGAQFVVDSLRGEVQMTMAGVTMPSGYVFPTAVTDKIGISYDKASSTLRLTGVLTQSQRDLLLAIPSLDASFKDAIAELYKRPRLAIKFVDPVFTAPLARLPAAVDFGALEDPALAARVGYDSEERSLLLTGTLSAKERDALQLLSSDSDFRKAVESLFTKPRATDAQGERWLEDGDLKWPLEGKREINLALAATRALAHLARRSAAELVVERVGEQLDLTNGPTRRLLSAYPLPTESLLTYLTGDFADTLGVVDHATLGPAFDGWYWASRVAALWRKWALTLNELKQLDELATPAELVDFAALTLDGSGPPVPIDRFLNTSRLILLKRTLEEREVGLFEVLSKLNRRAYRTLAEFAGDAQRLDPSWEATEVAGFVNSLDLAYPHDYLFPESWERLRRAFSLTQGIHAGAESAVAFGAATMEPEHAKSANELLRSKLGADDWLALSTEIQDRLRERKRDALVAYLLARPAPGSPPSGRWETPSDLYAYYLLDVDMSSCQLTSRLVQGSASVQLFVQRCLMGLEPDVRVVADGDDGDSAWRWWAWMRKYRVWQANREVFLWPENWIEPELNKNRSYFMKELEGELTQNPIDGYTVEDAFANYLEKLDGVAQLEPAGFYHEDDANDAILHVFARTKGAEPQVYYYRRHDYRQWTPWEKVDLEITDDYLIPAVVANRPFLFWPVFVEVPDEAANKKPISFPGTNLPVPPSQPQKKLRLRLAASEYRRGRWTPKRVSTQYAESQPYELDNSRQGYRFFAIDRGIPDHPFQVVHGGAGPYPGATLGHLEPGAFSLSGCRGVLELLPARASFASVVTPEGAALSSHDWQELPEAITLSARSAWSKWDDFTLHDWFLDEVLLDNAPRSSGPFIINLLANRMTVLGTTPGTFAVTPPWQMSWFDRLLAGSSPIATAPLAAGLWLPFFYADQERTFFAVPELPGYPRPKADLTLARAVRSFDFEDTSGPAHRYYREIKAYFQEQRDAAQLKWEETLDHAYFASKSEAKLHQLDHTLAPSAPPGWKPPFTEDQRRELFVKRFMKGEDYRLGTRAVRLFQKRRLEFKNFYHPFTCEFAQLVNDPLKGIPALMKRETQLQDSGFSFEETYAPTGAVADPWRDDYYPKEIVDFEPDGAYSSYNWELFFHIPLLIANTLSRNQRFEEARDWYHFIFNPLGIDGAAPRASATSRYWITKPFFEATDAQYIQQRIENILRMLAGDTTVPGFDLGFRLALEGQVRDWRSHPFEPHRIAAYRTVAYQKTVVIKYLDNLIAWGDYLFAQDSLESINEAAQLYVLAAELLGPPPRKMPPQSRPPSLTFNELEARGADDDDFSNALLELENLVPPLPGHGATSAESPPLPVLHFCIPQNEKLLGYWDTIADRLYKIRHCMNIEGVVRELALFEPRLDPGALVRAVAGGGDIGSALSDLNAPLPFHRFAVLLQKANEVCGDVKALGAALLAALEKKDAEELARCRSTQEIAVRQAATEVRQKQIDEARETLEALRRSKQLAELKRTYYSTRPFMNAGEITVQVLGGLAAASASGVPLGHALAGLVRSLPEASIGISGFGGSPTVTASSGGGSLAAMINEGTQALGATAGLFDRGAAIAGTLASYERRRDDWAHQAELAVKEIEQLDESGAAAEARLAAAEKELDVHLSEIENAKALDAFMRSKFTGQELYQWQIGQISNVYFQSYRLAYDLAKRAERCLRFELGLQDSSYVKFGHWDSLERGLLAGESLQLDLRRLEAGYLEQNRREFELTKHVSLRLLDPNALVKLRETGRCFFELPEEIFDLDYPGHYFRRLKSVSLTLPCVAGPYTTISCTLRLLRNTVRINTKRPDSYARNADAQGRPTDDDRFAETNIPIRAIATSSAQDDSGVFELSFRDERYLPFEGAGAISAWALELFSDPPSSSAQNPDFGRPLRQFDYDTIADAVLHLKYSAREDGGIQKKAVAHLRNYFAAPKAGTAAVMLNLRRDFPSQWSAFLNPTTATEGNVFELELSPGLFPVRDQTRKLAVDSIAFVADCSDGRNYTVTLTPPTSGKDLTLTRQQQYGGLHAKTWTLAEDESLEIQPDADSPPKWRIQVESPSGNDIDVDPATQESEVRDLIMILEYRWAGTT